MVESQNFERLQAIRDGDGSEVRQQFIYAGLLLTIFERFKEYIVDTVDGFFSEHSVIKRGELRHTRGDEFKKLMKEKGKGLPGQHGNQAFRAALHWFYDLGAITKEELEDVERIYTLRNEIGHELFLILADDRKEPITLMDVLITFSVYVKIVRWWFKEVEAGINPDFAGKTDSEIEWDEVESIDTVFLREILQKALVGNSEWEELQEFIHAHEAQTAENQ